MEAEEKNRIWIYILVVMLILGWLRFNNLKKENRYLKDESAEFEDRLVRYEYALQEANENIEQVNSTIEDAQSYAWSNYQEMGEALDNLETVDVVSEP